MISEVDIKDFDKSKYRELKETPLYSLPKNNWFKLEDNYFLLDHLDGMYSYCLDTFGKVVHIMASANVIPLRPLPSSLN